MAETSKIYEEREFLFYVDGKKTKVQHHIAKEVPLTVMLNGEKLATLVCSPHFFELLAIGFLVSGGFLQNRDQLKDVSYQPEQGTVWVDVVDGATRTDGVPERDFTSRRGKGQSLMHFPDEKSEQPVSPWPTFTVKELLGYMTLLNEKAEAFRLTGGVHEAALAHKGGFVARHEDIGRHNALDRLLGYVFLNEINTSDKAVILSGRIASEMLTKSARIGVPIVVSRSAPTCLSIDLAEQLGITLVGYARGNSLNVYTHPDRVIG